MPLLTGLVHHNSPLFTIFYHCITHFLLFVNPFWVFSENILDLAINPGCGKMKIVSGEGYVLFSVGILTVSDKGSQGQRQDRSGEVIRDKLSRVESHLVKCEGVPGGVGVIAGKLAGWADGGCVDVILTTGGSGLGPRDVTPEATLSVVEKVAPGFVEAMRGQTLSVTPMAMLSRAVAGVRGRCLIINLPGSPKAVQECLEVVLPVIPHAVEIIKGEVTEHAVPKTGVE